MEIYLGNQGDYAHYRPLSAFGGILALGDTGSGKTVYFQRVLRESMDCYTPEQVRFVVYSFKHSEYEFLENSGYLLYPMFGPKDKEAFLKTLRKLQLREETEPAILVFVDELDEGGIPLRSFGVEFMRLIDQGKAKNVRLFITFQRSTPCSCCFPSKWPLEHLTQNRQKGVGDFRLRGRNGEREYHIKPYWEIGNNL